MAWRLARSLDTFGMQIDTAWPSRSKASDGTIGDPAHSSRRSDHNPNSAGVVTARDTTHDPANGADMQAVFDALVAGRDVRLKYAIFNRKIVSSSYRPWKVRGYFGTNPHRSHLHLSVLNNYDDPRPWALGTTGGDMPNETDPARVGEMVDRGILTPSPTRQDTIDYWTSPDRMSQGGTSNLGHLTNVLMKWIKENPVQPPAPPPPSLTLTPLEQAAVTWAKAIDDLV